MALYEATAAAPAVQPALPTQPERERVSPKLGEVLPPTPPPPRAIEGEKPELLWSPLESDIRAVEALRAAFLDREPAIRAPPGTREFSADLQRNVRNLVGGTLLAASHTFPLAVELDQLGQDEDAAAIRRLALEMKLVTPVPPEVCFRMLAKLRRAGSALPASDPATKARYFVELLARMAPNHPEASVFRDEREEYFSIVAELEDAGLADLAGAMLDWVKRAVPDSRSRLPEPVKPAPPELREAAPAQPWVDADLRQQATKLHEAVWETIQRQTSASSKTVGALETRISATLATMNELAPLFLSTLQGMDRLLYRASTDDASDVESLRAVVAEQLFLAPFPMLQNSQAILACVVNLADSMPSLEEKVRFYIRDVLPKIAPFAPPAFDAIVNRFQDPQPYLTMARHFSEAGGDELERLASSLRHWESLRF